MALFLHLIINMNLDVQEEMPLKLHPEASRLKYIMAEKLNSNYKVTVCIVNNEGSIKMFMFEGNK